MATNAPAPPGPIGDYALLSDMRSAALVGKDGSIDWLCLPRFDSPSCFARILGTDHHGQWLIAPTAEVLETSRAYRADTLVLDTEFRTASGVVRLTDTMLPYDVDQDDSPAILRMVECLSGSVELKLRWVVRFAYAATLPWMRRLRGTDGHEYLLAMAGPDAVTLHGELLPKSVRGEHAHELTFTLPAGEKTSWVMAHCPDPDQPTTRPDAEQELAGSEDYWRAWAQSIQYSGPHAEDVRRSLVTLKALSYEPTGAIIAAATTSLPEAPGGNRNWDYRYCWLRDATLTLLALDDFGLTDEAIAWRRWLLRTIAGDPADVQIMYDVTGARHLIEWEAHWLEGYRGASPVRIGNAAYQQLQLDVFGEVMDALYVCRERGAEETRDSWSLQRGFMRHLEQIWEQPDQGLWEVRGDPRYFTYSRVMLWVAFDRAVRAVEKHGLTGPVERWRELRDRLHQEVCEKGWNEQIGAFTQYYGGTELDAANLRIPMVGFLPGTDDRVRSTVEAIGRELKDGDLVNRYTTESGQSAVDGLSGHEGSFLMCSFWYATALALIGRRQEAEDMFGRLLRLGNDVGLFAEEYDSDSGEFTGNFPQAFSHVALVTCAAQLYPETRTERAKKGSR